MQPREAAGFYRLPSRLCWEKDQKTPTCPPTEAGTRAVASTEPRPRRSGGGARTQSGARGVESNKGTCKPRLVPPLTIWRACFGIKGFLCAPEEASEQPLMRKVV